MFENLNEVFDFLGIFVIVVRILFWSVFVERDFLLLDVWIFLVIVVRIEFGESGVRYIWFVEVGFF